MTSFELSQLFDNCYKPYVFWCVRSWQLLLWRPVRICHIVWPTFKFWKNKRKITLIMKFAAGLLALASADVKIIGGFTPTPNSEPYILSLQKVSPRFLLLFLEHFLEWFSFLRCNHRIRHPLCLCCSLLSAKWSHCCCRCSRHLKKWVKPAKAERYFFHQPRELQL